MKRIIFGLLFITALSYSDTEIYGIKIIGDSYSCGVIYNTLVTMSHIRTDTKDWLYLIQNCDVKNIVAYKSSNYEGGYTDGTTTIYINTGQYTSKEKMMETIAHESWHVLVRRQKQDINIEEMDARRFGECVKNDYKIYLLLNR